MAEVKTIYCPKCGRRVASWDGKSSMNIVVKCKNCFKKVVFDVNTLETKISELPGRNTSSGMTII